MKSYLKIIALALASVTIASAFTACSADYDVINQTETHLGTIFDFEHNTYQHALETGQYFDDSDRVVFDIVKQFGRRKYVFRGVFRLNKAKCTLCENVWELVLSEYRI